MKILKHGFWHVLVELVLSCISCLTIKIYKILSDMCYKRENLNQEIINPWVERPEIITTCCVATNMVQIKSWSHRAILVCRYTYKIFKVLHKPCSVFILQGSPSVFHFVTILLNLSWITFYIWWHACLGWLTYDNLVYKILLIGLNSLIYRLIIQGVKIYSLQLPFWLVN